MPIDNTPRLVIENQSITITLLQHPAFPLLPVMLSAIMQETERQQRREECERQVAFYQSQFPDVPTMTSQELLEIMRRNESSSDVVLVDVRTREEQAVSMISGAVPLQDFDLSSSSSKHSENTTIVTYCTVGYRSGQEARHLQNLHPEWKGKIYNLDGILAYTYVEDAPPLVTKTNCDGGKTHEDAPQVEQQPTRQVHTYGSTWNCANPDYQAVWFENHSFLRKFFQTVCRSVLRFSQHRCCRCCHGKHIL
jgi:rhodanese-related sulfurtransferase